MALFTRAGIEMIISVMLLQEHCVALFTRAWIEMFPLSKKLPIAKRRPLHEGVD